LSAQGAHERITAYAIVRLDHYLEAELEVARLNALNDQRDRTYFWQYTRYFPEGRGVRPQ